MYSAPVISRPLRTPHVVAALAAALLLGAVACEAARDGAPKGGSSADPTSPAASAEPTGGAAPGPSEGDAREPARDAAAPEEAPACACTGVACCPPEAPSVCVDGQSDDSCGSGSSLCASCGATSGCRAVDGGFACVPVLGANAPCTSGLDCKSRLCLSGSCASGTACIALGAPCGAGHVGSCCGGLTCGANTCCLSAGKSVPANTPNAMCCPGLSGRIDPGTGTLTCS